MGVTEGVPHYTQGGIECIDAIRAALTKEEFIGYCKGNVLKYTWRARHKGNAVGDMKKAQDYARWAAEAGQDVQTLTRVKE